MFFKPSRKNKEWSDEELLTAYRQSDDLEYLAMLYDRYMHLVYGVCLKYLEDQEESRDAVMQIFEKLITEVVKFDIRNFGSWLHVISKNHCLMKIRAEKTQQKHADHYVKEKFMEFGDDSHPSDELVADIHIEIMLKCMEKLPPDQRNCIDLFFMQEKSYGEIVELAGLELKKVKSHLQNGKRNIKLCIEKNLDK